MPHMKQRPFSTGPAPQTPGGAYLLAIFLLATMTACESEQEGQPEAEVEDLTIVVEADKSRILEEEAALSHERQEVESARDKLLKEKQEISRKLASLSKKDRKQREMLESEQSRISREEARLRDRQRSFEAERLKLEREKNQLIERIASMTASKGGLTIEQREARIAQREREIARREREVAERENALAKREAQASATLQELTGVLAGLREGGVTKTVIVNNAPPSASASATRSQAQKAQKALRNKMDAKGILMDDLPPTAKSVYEQGNNAMAAKDFGDAVAAFEQVQAIVDGIAINQSFVQGKMARLNRAITQTKLDDDLKKRVQGLLAEVSDAAADGRYDRANKKANQIATALRSN